VIHGNSISSQSRSHSTFLVQGKKKRSTCVSNYQKSTNSYIHWVPFDLRAPALMAPTPPPTGRVSLFAPDLTSNSAVANPSRLAKACVSSVSNTCKDHQIRTDIPHAIISCFHGVWVNCQCEKAAIRALAPLKVQVCLRINKDTRDCICSGRLDVSTKGRTGSHGRSCELDTNGSFTCDRIVTG